MNAFINASWMIYHEYSTHSLTRVLIKCYMSARCFSKIKCSFETTFMRLHHSHHLVLLLYQMLQQSFIHKENQQWRLTTTLSFETRHTAILYRTVVRSPLYHKWFNSNTVLDYLDHQVWNRARVYTCLQRHLQWQKTVTENDAIRSGARRW